MILLDGAGCAVTVAGLLLCLALPLYSLASLFFLAALALLACLPVWPIPRAGLKRVRRTQLAVAAAALAFFLVFPHIPLGEFRSRLDRLNLLMESLQGRELSWQDKTSIYSLGILMGAGGFAFGYPEVAREHLLLYLPGPRLRIWKSDFPMGAAAIRRTLKPFAQGLTTLSPGDSEATLSPKVVTFRYGRDPLRYALALNPAAVTATARRRPGSDVWTLQVRADVKVAYAERGRVVLPLPFSPRSLPIAEGMFWRLQQAGWLFPYTARWEWELFSDDPRLAGE
jgi:hypothetical protein